MVKFGKKKKASMDIWKKKIRGTIVNVNYH